MTVMFFKIRQKRQQGFLTGFAGSVVIGDGRVLLRDRRVPVATVQDNKVIAHAEHLGDLELSGDSESGWAAWSYPVDTPRWWDSLATEKESSPDGDDVADSHADGEDPGDDDAE